MPLNEKEPKMQHGYDTHRLCYVAGQFAYFTNLPLAEQSGDDWNDEPYEYNAGRPREDVPGQIIKVAFDGEWLTPADRWGVNIKLSVDTINACGVAWLYCETFERPKHHTILAGATIREFIAKISAYGGGKCYLPPELIAAPAASAAPVVPPELSVTEITVMVDGQIRRFALKPVEHPK